MRKEGGGIPHIPKIVRRIQFGRRRSVLPRLLRTRGRGCAGGHRSDAVTSEMTSLFFRATADDASEKKKGRRDLLRPFCATLLCVRTGRRRQSPGLHTILVLVNQTDSGWSKRARQRE